MKWGISMKDLKVVDVYTTNNGGNNDGAMTLTCKVGDTFVDVRTIVLYDENGNLVDGDGILYIFGKYMTENGFFRNSTVVTTIMSNYGLYKAFDELGINYAKTAVKTVNL